MVTKEQLLEEIERQKSQLKVSSDNKKCNSCGLVLNSEDKYYTCREHKKVFCHDCIINGKEIDGEMHPVWCARNPTPCIYEVNRYEN